MPSASIRPSATATQASGRSSSGVTARAPVRRSALRGLPRARWRTPGAGRTISPVDFYTPGGDDAARDSAMMSPVSEDAWKAQLEALGALVRAQRVAADLSLRDLSARTKVSNAYLSQVERGLHEPSLSVLRAIASALGVPLAALLTRAGMLDGDADDDALTGLRETEAAILRDPELSEPHRTALLSVYRSFVPPRRRS
jgi:transcriptional regulator with XRE-family HTH domain